MWSFYSRTDAASCMSNIPFWLCCGAGMFIPDPDFYPSRIPDLGPGSGIPDPGFNNSNKRGEGKIIVRPFFIASKFKKFKKG